MKKNIHTLFKNKGKVESGKKKQRRKSLGRFVGYFMIIASLLSIVVMFSSSYIQTENLLNERNQLSKETAAQVMEKTLSDIASDAEAKVNAGTSLSGFTQGEFTENEILDTMKTSFSGNGAYSNVYFGTQSGKLYALNSLSEKIDPRTQDWYRGAMSDTSSVYWTKPAYDASTGQYYSIVSSAVENSSNQRGVLALRVEYDKVEAAIGPLNVGEKGTITMISKQGAVMGNKSCDTKEVYKKGQDISSSDVYKKIKAAKGLRRDFEGFGNQGSFRNLLQQGQRKQSGMGLCVCSSKRSQRRIGQACHNIFDCFDRDDRDGRACINVCDQGSRNHARQFYESIQSRQGRLFGTC